MHGVAGIGKSVLVRNVVNYLQERLIFDGGIIYLNIREFKDLKSEEDFYKLLIKTLRDDNSGRFKHFLSD